MTEGFLEQAIALLPVDAVLECEEGTLGGCREWLRHSEPGLAFEDPGALGRVNAVPREYRAGLRDAAEKMGPTENVEERNRIIEQYSA